jgi:molecular chaperone GrpE
MNDEQDKQDHSPEQTSANRAGEAEPSPTPETAAKAETGPEAASLREQLEAARAERDEHYNLALRTQAELENFRKRINRERDEEARYRALPLARDLLPALDNLRRALDAAGKTGNVNDLIQGVEMVLKQLEDTLAAHAVKPIAAEGEKFDPNRHDALTQVPSAEHERLSGATCCTTACCVQAKSSSRRHRRRQAARDSETPALAAGSYYGSRGTTAQGAGRFA